MIKFTKATMYSTAAAIIVTGLTLASPLYAAKYDINKATETPPQPIYADNDVKRSPPSRDYMTPTQRRNATAPSNYNRDNREWHVEDRINSLHQELRITQDQEPQWQQVAAVMRVNDENIRHLVQERHRNANAMNAVADLESYQTVAQAHVDGLQRLIPVFNELYSDMSDAQRNQADDAFNRFQGRMSSNRHK